MNQIVSKDSIVGSYEDINIIHCQLCGENRIETFSLVKPSLEAPTYIPAKAICSCGSNNCSITLGKKFTCPKCKKENTSIIEPSKIRHIDGTTFICYESNSVTCSHCEADFGACLFVDSEEELINPNSWKRVLYEK
jgi:hypothetical protein